MRSEVLVVGSWLVESRGLEGLACDATLEEGEMPLFFVCFFFFCVS